MKLKNELHTTENFDLIEKKKKSDLNILRQQKLPGLLYQIKNAVGEKPSFFFYKSRNKQLYK